MENSFKSLDQFSPENSFKSMEKDKSSFESISSKRNKKNNCGFHGKSNNEEFKVLENDIDNIFEYNYPDDYVYDKNNKASSNYRFYYKGANADELLENNSDSVHNTFMFQYRHKPAPPKKRKCTLLPSKRTKFFIDYKVPTIVHKLSDAENEAQMLAKCYSDYEYKVGSIKKQSRQRSASSVEDGFFCDKDFPGISSTFFQKKRLPGRERSFLDLKIHRDCKILCVKDYKYQSCGYKYIFIINQ